MADAPSGSPVLPSQVAGFGGQVPQQSAVPAAQPAEQAPARGTPAAQQDLPDDGSTTDFAFEAYDAMTGETNVDPQGHVPLHLREPSAAPDPAAPQQGVPGQQQQVQQTPEVGIPEFRLLQDGPDGSPAVVPPGVAQQQVQQPPTVTPQVQQPVPQVTPPVQPGQQPPATATTEQTPQQQQDPFEAAHAAIAAQEKQFTAALAEHAYKIPEEDFTKFISGDSSQASMLAARVHVNVMASVMKVLAQQMPVVMNRLLSVHEVNRQAEDQFWGTNKFLDRNNQQHIQAVNVASRAVRHANPQADTQTVTRMAGLMAAMTLGIDPAAAMTRVQQQVHGRPMVQTPGRVVRQAPPSNQPVAPSGVHGSNGAQPASEWDVLSRIMQADDAGTFEGR